MTLKKYFPFLGFILVSILTVVAYTPGLHGPFVFDDVVNITDSSSIKLTKISFQDLASSIYYEEGSLPGRAISRISYALNYYLAGAELNAYAFKTTNLAIHLINAWLVYWLVTLLFKQLKHFQGYSSTEKYDRWLPCLAAAIWAIHPLQLTSILYVVQRMTSLSAFFVLAGLIASIHGRQRFQEGRAHGSIFMAGGLIGGSFLGWASKENAILLPLFMLLIEWIFFKRAALEKKSRRRLWLLYSLIFAPYVLGLLWLVSNPGIILDGYSNREFTLTQRVLTEPRVLWYYLELLLIPRLSELGLFHDDIVLSTNLISPWTTLPASASLLIGVVFSIVRRKKYPVLSFAILWYVLGHSIESSVIGLEIAHEHRNYLPSIGPIMGLSYGLILFYGRFHNKTIPSLLSIILFLVLSISTYVRADTWRSEESIIESMARHHPASPRSQFMMGELYTYQKHDPFKALLHYSRAYELAPHETGYLIRIAISALSAHPQSASPTGANNLDTYHKTTALPSPIVVSKTVNNRMQLVLNPEFSRLIADRLRQRPLTENTRHTMHGLSQCLAEKTEICKNIYSHIVEWYKAMLANPHLTNKVRKESILSLFEIGITSKDYNLAMESARYGQTTAPSDLNYLLMEANVYILLNRIDAAEKLIHSVIESNKYSGDYISDNVDILTSEISARRKKSDKSNNR
ncbi:MAG: hypothetical protein A3A87_09995 [Candidatus Muproteobacteria bacterium RIFCSPLOWO2_01_FULL_60_18]|uniref:Tetratricopeptide repeat protein n=1 Tax=Candidatus Muproteobacteria bacterium RIFCSPLOWO2_01_FULL_60_18 TaxID=1817768 RepID=A0A1F6U2Q1_9PROT|nr:MAG: hypothetical protein A3A87_09995 [Candidatus Muproteobacteria bacterium RIFCSPLOWO2_01_FULL_60_18]